MSSLGSGARWNMLHDAAKWIASADRQTYLSEGWCTQFLQHRCTTPLLALAIGQQIGHCTTNCTGMGVAITTDTTDSVRTSFKTLKTRAECPYKFTRLAKVKSRENIDCLNSQVIRAAESTQL